MLALDSWFPILYVPDWNYLMKNPNRFWKIIQDKTKPIHNLTVNGNQIYTARLTQHQMLALVKQGCRFERFHNNQVAYIKSCVKRGESWSSTYSFTKPD